MWFVGVEVEEETSAPSPKKNPGSAPVFQHIPIVYDKSGWASSLSLVYDQQERSYRGASLACMEIRWRNEETINCTRDRILKVSTSYFIDVHYSSG